MAEKHAREPAVSDLFANHGVSGASLQMIADRLDVTTAAVDHRLPAEDEIVLGLPPDRPTPGPAHPRTGSSLDRPAPIDETPRAQLLTTAHRAPR